jgi:hypothetical protein
MTKNLTIFSALIASLIYVGAVVGLIVLGARFLEEGLVDLPKEWTAVLILILFTVVFCSFLISNALKNNLEKRNQSVILDRLGVYKRLLDLVDRRPIYKFSGKGTLPAVLRHEFAGLRQRI